MKRPFSCVPGSRGQRAGKLLAPAPSACGLFQGRRPIGSPVLLPPDHWGKAVRSLSRFLTGRAPGRKGGRDRLEALEREFPPKIRPPRHAHPRARGSFERAFPIVIGAFHRNAPQAVEKPLESARRPEPSRTTIVPGGLNGGDGGIFAAEKSIFRSNNRFLAVFVTGIRRIQAKTGEGGRGGGACFPVHPLVKNRF